MRRRLPHWLALLFLVAYTPQAFAQSPSELAAAQVQELANALRSLDAEKVVFYSAPKFRAAMGGEQQMLRAVTQQFERGRAAGVRVEVIEFGAPTELGKNGNALFTFIPYTAVARSRTQVVTDRAFYLALSEDDGKTWKFVDGIRLDAELLRYFLPAYAGEPPLPTASRQVQPVEGPR